MNGQFYFCKEVHAKIVWPAWGRKWPNTSRLAVMATGRTRPVADIGSFSNGQKYVVAVLGFGNLLAAPQCGSPSNYLGWEKKYLINVKCLKKIVSLAG